MALKFAITVGADNFSFEGEGTVSDARDLLGLFFDAIDKEDPLSQEKLDKLAARVAVLHDTLKASVDQTRYDHNSA